MAKTKKEVKEALAPDYQVALAKGETSVNILVKDDEYTVHIDGLKAVKKLEDLSKLRELLNTAIENIIGLSLYEPELNDECCECDECSECDECHVGPCYTVV